MVKTGLHIHDHTFFASAMMHMHFTVAQFFKMETYIFCCIDRIDSSFDIRKY